MRKIHVLAILLISPFLVGMVVGCGGQSSPQSTTVTATTTTSGGATFGQFADAGKTVFTSRCSKCHGDQGQGITGPAVIGPSANLVKYATAQGLLNFVSTAMPLDAPGSLSHQEYLQVFCFLLVQNNDASASGAFSESALANVQLK
jgi:cytochrome c